MKKNAGHLPAFFFGYRVACPGHGHFAASE
jgi:hypothetical protein